MAKPSELRLINPDAHGIAAFTVQADIGNAIKVFEPVNDEAVHIVRERQGIHAGGAYNEKDDGLGISFHFGNGGF